MRIGRAEEKDIDHYAARRRVAADRGARVGVADPRRGRPDEPDEGDELLGPAGGAPAPAGEDAPARPGPRPRPAANARRFDGLRQALNAGGASAAATAARAAKAAQARQREQDEILAALEETVGPMTDEWLDKIRLAVNEAPDLESLAARVVELFPTLVDTSPRRSARRSPWAASSRDLSAER